MAAIAVTKKKNIWETLERVDFESGGYAETSVMFINGIGVIVRYSVSVNPKSNPSVSMEFVPMAKIVDGRLDRGF